jgi:hypothetical protein
MTLRNLPMVKVRRCPYCARVYGTIPLRRHYYKDDAHWLCILKAFASDMRYVARVFYRELKRWIK